MAEINELIQRYDKIPQELKQLRNWVCYKLVKREGKVTKVPVNPHSKEGNLQGAKSNDPSTWGDFQDAVMCCWENDLDGIGFELDGSGMFGVDLDNHPNENGEVMPEAEFQALANEFVAALDSYTEWSVSGNGIHILCYGSLPKGRKRNGNVEMYDSVRFFAMTGNAIRCRGIQERTQQIIPLWKKYVDDSEEVEKRRRESEERNRRFIESLSYDTELGNLTDEEVVERGCRSEKIGLKFARLINGKLDDYNGDHSHADQALCNYLAFYTNCNAEQMDRIFRRTKLMRDKWDEPRGDSTYGAITIQNAIDSCTASYVVKKQSPSPLDSAPQEPEDDDIPSIGDRIAESAKQPQIVMNLDEDGEPIFRLSDLSKKKKDYPLDDTGNAERFYDCFGEHFRYNATDKMFMFWTGKTWIYDTKGIIRKYANQLIVMMKSEVDAVEEKIRMAHDDTERKRLAALRSEIERNMTRVSNKAGKDAMLAELQTMGHMAVENGEFNQDPYLLNTESGVVDLRTGEIKPFAREYMLSNNTGIKVSFEEPTQWLKFLNSIFERGNAQETAEIVKCLQRCLGYTLTGLVTEQVMFLLHGGGSNGKSTLATVLQRIMGDYYKSIDSSQLMVQKNQNVSVQYSLAELISTRYLVTQETDVGAKLSESIIKQITGGDPINAQKKYGRPFQFNPSFKVWMMTNNLPIIRGTDYGIWRRIFLFPFKKQFKDGEKDKDMPEKLAAEYDRILGWCIQGAKEYLAEKTLLQPSCLRGELSVYQSEMDVVSKFLSSECVVEEGATVTKNDLYRAFKQWSMDNNEYAMPESKFRDELGKKGFKISTSQYNGVKTYQGIRLSGDQRGAVGGSYSAFGEDY